MKVAKDTVVTLDYHVADPDGTVVDEGRAPIEYLHGGYGDIFARIEAALDGKAVGDTVRVTLEPKDGFGEYDPALVAVEALDRFEAPPAVGAQVERADDGGQSRLFTITEVKDGRAVVDGNHPLAGLTLVFAATVTAIRSATEGEVAARIAPPPGVAAAPDPSADAPPRKYHSETHRLCHVAPMLILPALAVPVWQGGWTAAAGALLAAWMLWVWMGRQAMAAAIGKWGERFLFFDFSPNLHPSPLERRIAMVGGAVPLGVAAVLLVAMLVMSRSWSDVAGALGTDLVVFLVLAVPGIILMPFLIVVFTGFRVRPVIDDA